MADEPASRVDILKTYLRQQGLGGEMMELKASTRTAAEAAQALDCRTEQIVKSMVLKTKRSRRGILVLASGANRVDLKKIAARLSEPVRMADPQFVLDQTGFAVGGVPPVAHVQKLDTFIDEDLIQQDKIWAAAGTHHAMFSLTPGDLVQMTSGMVISIK